METGGTSPIFVVLWVLLANVVVILTAYGLVIWWRKKSQETVRKIGAEIQAHDNQLAELISFLRAYGGIKQEPFSTPLDELQTDIDEMQAQLQHFLETGQVFDEELRGGSENMLQSVISAPFIWFRRWRHARGLERESAEIAARLSEAEARVQRIYEIPWNLAVEIREAAKEVDEVAKIAQQLQAKGVRGAALQTILSQVPQINRALDEAPDEFYDAGHDQLLAAANLDSTIRVFEALNRIRPALKRYLPQVRDWSASYEKAAAEYAGLKQAGAALRQALASPPPGLSIAPLQARLDQLAQMASELGQQVAAPEAESLKLLAREVGQLRRVILDTEQQFQRLIKQVSELSQSIAAMHDSLAQMGDRHAILERRGTFPLTLDESGRRLADLRRKLDALGPAQQPRTPEQVAQQVKEIEAIRAGYKALHDSYPSTAEQHNALVTLLESEEIREGAAWLRKARETARQADVYDARNWPKQDAIHALHGDLDELEEQHQRLTPPDPAAPLTESGLDQRLKETQQVAARHKALRGRVENIRARLEKIKQVEKEGKDRLTGAWTALERVALLAESNDLLEEIAGKDIDRMGEEIRQAGNELNAQGQGEVEKKMQKIHALADRVNGAMNGWLAQLNTAIAEQGRKITELLSKVDAVGTLEDGPVNAARGLLARDEFRTAARTTGSLTGATAARVSGAARNVAARITHSEQKPALADLEVTAEIKRKNDLWQSLTAAGKELEEKTGPLLSAYQEMFQARGEANERLAELAQRLPEKRTWPPSNQASLPASQALQPVDEKWEAFKKQPSRLETAILELGRLTQQYRLVNERAQNLIGRVEQDQERIQEQEWQIEDLKQRWQAQAQADANNPVIREGVRQLMSQADSRLAYIKHQFMRGALSYEQVIHNLQLLYDELHTARVSVDDTHDIGLNENRPAHGLR